MSHKTVIVFARNPEHGKVKTRLARAIGEAAALALHRSFLLDTLEAARGAGASVILSHTPGPAFPEMDDADELVSQRGASFGERVDGALADARALRPSGPLLIVGADTPHLSPASISRALDVLSLEGETRTEPAARSELSVIGPSTAGGFYLLGFADRIPSITSAFDGPNEAARLARTLESAGLRPVVIEPFFDIDVPGDLIGLILHLELLAAASAEWIPLRTAETITSLGLRAIENGEGGTRGYRLVGPRDSG